ncbi:dienelactone hydrolase family protein [Bacillus sp. B190/17]|uniref:Dienelactone hydrolase family protein n=1 Tax=Bacillus lumedeiriae TaxID=3058829 RepID=A0ABW8I9R4_9BACI
MINIRKNSNTLIIVLHEIYGINKHIKGVCQALSDYGFDIFCPNLLEREAPFAYIEEEIAYRYFMNNIGFARAVYKVEELLAERKSEYQKIFIVGFSVGATVAWLCSEKKYINGMVGYYGSRIRDYIEISPQCPVMLFYPEEEISFNVDDFISTLHQMNVQTHKYKGQHGFSDLCSPKYHAESAQKAFNDMINFFVNIR